MSAATKGRWSPTTRTWEISGWERIGFSRAAGATFLPPAVTIISFARPVILTYPSRSKEPRSPVLNQPSSVKQAAVASGSLL